MSTAQDKLRAQAASLRKKLAAAAATADQLRAKLALIEARITGGPIPLSGLEILWQAALPMSRQRSSKHRCRTAWNRIPIAERPRIETMIAALKAWNRCEEWKKDGNQFAPGLHRFIAERMWEDLPESSSRDVAARYRTTPKPIPQPTGEEITDPLEIARLLSVRPLRMPS